MNRELVLNELSLEQPAESALVARERMSLLIATLVAAVQAGAARALRTTEDFNSTLLAPGYLLAQWRNDPQAGQEERSYFRSIQSKAPYLRPEDGIELVDRADRIELYFGKRKALGLGAAFLLEALAVSLSSEACWESTRLSLRCLFLSDQGNLEEESAEVSHACRTNHVSVHLDWLAGRDLPVRSGRELWERREQLFPSLVFCESVAHQLADAREGHPLFRQIWKRLHELDRSFRGWDGSHFDPSVLPMKITGESPSTLDRYSEDRTFLCPDGEYRLFVLHTRLTPGAWRIYFFPHPETRKNFVGYIGKKPPSTLYPA